MKHVYFSHKTPIGKTYMLYYNNKIEVTKQYYET